MNINKTGISFDHSPYIPSDGCVKALISSPDGKDEYAQDLKPPLSFENPPMSGDNEESISRALLQQDIYRRLLTSWKGKYQNHHTTGVKRPQLRPLGNDLQTDPVQLSQDLIQELKNWPPTATLDGLTKGMETLLNAISTVTDKASLATLNANIEIFDQLRAEKAQSGAEWDALQDLVMSIQTALVEQQAKLPDEDMHALVEKIQSQMQEMMKKMDQLSPEQITAMNRRINSLQKVIDGMSVDLKAILKQEIANLNAKVDERVQALIDLAIKKNVVLDFELVFLGYLEKGDGSGVFDLLLGKLQEIDDERERTDIALLMVMNYFSMENFPKWMRFLNGVEAGISIDSMRIVKPNPLLANKIRQTYLDLIHRENILTVIRAQDTYLPLFTDMTTNHLVREDNFNPDKPPTIRWNTLSGVAEEGVITSVTMETNDTLGQEGLWFNYELKKKEGQMTLFKIRIYSSSSSSDESWCHDAIVDNVLVKGDCVNDPTAKDIIAFNHFVMRQVDALEREAYLSNATQLLQDLADAVDSSLRLADIKKLLDDRLFSHQEIEKVFGIQTLSALLPPLLTREMLLSPCPFETNKKIFETHFLFFIPAYMAGKDLSWVSFVTNYTHETLARLWGSFSIKEANLVVDEHVYLNEMMEGGKWVFLYTSGATQRKADYRRASLAELITALSFWRARDQEPHYPFNLMAVPPNPNVVYNFDDFYSLYTDHVEPGRYVIRPYSWPGIVLNDRADIFITTNLKADHDIMVRNF